MASAIGRCSPMPPFVNWRAFNGRHPNNVSIDSCGARSMKLPQRIVRVRPVRSRRGREAGVELTPHLPTKAYDMWENLAEEVRECLRHAEECAARAKIEPHPAIQ